jgi:hypothetical protein
MAITHFIQTIWSKKIQDELELKLKLVKNCLRTYEGDVKYARTVKILGVGEPTITAYDGSKPLTYEAMTDKGQEMHIDQQYSFSFLVDDINQAQSVPGLKEEYQRKAVHGLAAKADTYVSELLAAGTNVTTATGNDYEAVQQAFDLGIVAMRERNFDEEGVIEMGPAVYNKFKHLLITLSTDNPDYIKRGVVGMYDGFEVIMSNNMKKDSGHNYCAIRGKKAIAFADQINEVEAMRSEQFFADLVRGLYTFGGKTIDNNRLQVVKIPV